MRTLRRPVSILLLLWHAPACTSYQTPKGLSPQEAVAGRKVVAVTYWAPASPVPTRVEVWDPWIRNDSLGGATCRSDIYSRCETESVVAIPLHAVVAFETRSVDAVQTVSTVLGVTVAVALSAGVVLAVACRGNRCWGR